MLYRGHVQKGVIVLDDPVQLKDGTGVQVTIIVPPKPLEGPTKGRKRRGGLARFAGILDDLGPPEVSPEAQADLIWLVEHPEKNMGAKYHDSARCWDLIEAGLAEIRKLRGELARIRQDEPKR